MCESTGKPVQPTYCSLPAELTTMGSSGVPVLVSERVGGRRQGAGGIPRRLASRGLMSKMSMPCIFPRISRRSRPVACSASVGTVPGLAPAGSRSSMDLISACHQRLASCCSRVRGGRARGSLQNNACAQSRTVELLEAREDAGGVGGVAGLLLVGGLGLRVACCEVNGVLVGSSRGVPYGAQRWW